MVAALQASGAAVFWRSARRSGVTPGTMVTGSFRRVTVSALFAHAASRRTRRVGAPTTFSRCGERVVLIDGLAEAFLSGPWDLESLVDRGGRVLGRRYRWLRPLARRILSAFPRGPRPRAARLADSFVKTGAFGWRGNRNRSSCTSCGGRVARWCLRRDRRHPGRCRQSRRPANWPDFSSSSRNSSTGSPTARPAKASASVEALRHYRYRWVAKPSGSFRLIEAPKPRLKQLQRGAAR